MGAGGIRKHNHASVEKVKVLRDLDFDFFNEQLDLVNERIATLDQQVGALFAREHVAEAKPETWKPYTEVHVVWRIPKNRGPNDSNTADLYGIFSDRRKADDAVVKLQMDGMTSAWFGTFVLDYRVALP